MRLRQIALATSNLAEATTCLGRIFGIDEFHEGSDVATFGLRNAVFRFGDSFLELLQPIEDDTTVERLLVRRGGDCGYMVILQTDAIDEARARLAATDVRVVAQFDEDGAGYTHLHPRDVGGTLLSIDYMPEWERWEWAGPDWHLHGAQLDEMSITGAEMRCADPGAIAARWTEVIGLPFDERSEGYSIDLIGSELRFVPLAKGQQDGFQVFDVRASRPELIRSRAQRLNCLNPDGTISFCGMSVRMIGPTN